MQFSNFCFESERSSRVLQIIERCLSQPTQALPLGTAMKFFQRRSTFSAIQVCVYLKGRLGNSCAFSCTINNQFTFVKNSLLSSS